MNHIGLGDAAEGDQVHGNFLRHRMCFEVDEMFDLPFSKVSAGKKRRP
jgi:hypothetical protein